MATYSYGSESTTLISNSSNASNWTGSWTFAAINAIAKANIPANATITAFSFTVYAKEQGGTFNSDIDIFFANSSNDSVKSLYSNDNCVYDSGYSTYALDLKANVQSGNASAGQIAYSSADRICVKLEKTTSLGTNRKWQCYYVAKWEYTLPTYTVTLDPNGGSVSPTSLSITGGNTYGTLPTPTRTGYTFNYWTLNGTRIYSTTVVNSSHTLVANWTVNTYTVTWKNADGTVLETDTGVAYGTTPTYNGSTPTKASTAQYDYTFSGWSPSVSAITGATIYTAQFTAAKRKYTVSVSGENGSVTGGGTYEYGSSVILTAIPNGGHVFKQWSDGNTDNPRTVTVTGNVTYTAVFETLVYVSYDTVLSYQKWKDTGISAGNGVISNVTDTGFTLTSNSGVSEATASSPYFAVEPGKAYKIDIDITGDNWDVYIFFCNESGDWVDFADGPTNRYSSSTTWESVFTAPDKEEVVKAKIRVDANGSENTVSYSNFRIYPADCPYMSTSVTATDRTDTGSWSIPTPVREGYTFKGWNTNPNGTGTAYTSDSTFPTSSMVLYSQWEDVLPEFTLVQMLYNNKQISKDNKVPAGQSFRLIAGVK